jgi:hypothetical protein
MPPKRAGSFPESLTSFCRETRYGVRQLAAAFKSLNIKRLRPKAQASAALQVRSALQRRPAALSEFSHFSCILRQKLTGMQFPPTMLPHVLVAGRVSVQKFQNKEL